MTLSIFARLIVDDEEKIAAYYAAVYGPGAAAGIAGNSLGTGEAFREVIMTRGADVASGALVMFKFTDRPKLQQLILGFVREEI